MRDLLMRGAAYAPLDSTGGGMSGAAQPGNNILSPWTQQQMQADAQANALIRQTGTKYLQLIQSFAATPVFGSPYLFNIPIQLVGLITKFYVVATVTVTNPAGGNMLTRAQFAPWNIFSTVQYTDPNANQRINTTGWHIGGVAAIRHRRIPGAAYTTDSPAQFGSVLAPIAAPPAIAPGASGTLRAIYEIPLAYSSEAMTGAVYAGAVFATQSLQLTIGANSIAQAGADPLGTCYTGAAAGANAPTYAVNLNVYQEYWDGFPLSLLAPLQPSLSTVYELKTTGINSISANYDNYVRFNNLRTFMSLLLYYDNGGVLNYGSDINYFKLVSANQTTLWQREAQLQSYLTRQQFGDDFPSQCYVFDFRRSPIITAAEGNTVLSMNPSSAANGATLLTAFEDLATNTVLASAPSLSGNIGIA
jgi:hypothetical protein